MLNRLSGQSTLRPVTDGGLPISHPQLFQSPNLFDLSALSPKSLRHFLLSTSSVWDHASGLSGSSKSTNGCKMANTSTFILHIRLLTHLRHSSEDYARLFYRLVSDSRFPVTH
jgi:hypothetical protein